MNVTSNLALQEIHNIADFLKKNPDRTSPDVLAVVEAVENGGGAFLAQNLETKEQAGMLIAAAHYSSLLRLDIDLLKTEKEQQHMEIVAARDQGQKYAADNHALRKQIDADAFKNDWKFNVCEKDPVSVYVQDYCLICEGNEEYTPTDFEMCMIVDALHGFESEQDKEIQVLRTKVAELEASQAMAVQAVQHFVAFTNTVLPQIGKISVDVFALNEGLMLGGQFLKSVAKKPDAVLENQS